jgi:hypothetical protein
MKRLEPSEKKTRQKIPYSPRKTTCKYCGVTVQTERRHEHSRLRMYCNMRCYAKARTYTRNIHMEVFKYVEKRLYKSENVLEYLQQQTKCEKSINKLEKRLYIRVYKK